MSQFERGRAKSGGRAKGARNKISTAFLEELSAHFEKEGHKAIELCFHEKPIEYLKIIASVLPKEFEVTENRLAEIPDDELEFIIQHTRRELSARLERIGGGEGPEADGREIELLPPLSKAN